MEKKRNKNYYLNFKIKIIKKRKNKRIEKERKKKKRKKNNRGKKKIDHKMIIFPKQRKNEAKTKLDQRGFQLWKNQEEKNIINKKRKIMQ